MQIAGKTCNTCGGTIVFSDEGEFCGKCEIVVHISCQEHDCCPVCGGQLKAYERPKTDPRLESVRFDSSMDQDFGPAVAILFVVFALIAVGAAFLWEIVRPQGF